MPKIVIIGAFGLVGSELIKCINENENLIDENELIFVGTSRNNSTIILKNKEYTVFQLDDVLNNEPKIYINCATNEVSKKIYNYLDNSFLIDNSSAFRMDENCPLIIPEINMDKIDYKIYPSPNCCVIILAFLLNSFIKNNINISKVDVSTYQSASGAGIYGYNELITQTKEFSSGQKLTTEFWKRQYIHNVFCHNTSINLENGYNNEEEKIIQEIPKIFNKNIPVNPTCIRVPTLRSHCLSVSITFDKSLEYKDIIKYLEEDENIVIMDEKESNTFPDSIISNDNHKIFVGHIRADLTSNNHRWNFFISGDQLKRGAAYNVYMILLKLLEK